LAEDTGFFTDRRSSHSPRYRGIHARRKVGGSMGLASMERSWRNFSRRNKGASE